MHRWAEADATQLRLSNIATRPCESYLQVILGRDFEDRLGDADEPSYLISCISTGNADIE
jgi:hypothetical protein